MARYAEPLARLIEELERMPGIGPKSAQRLAYYLLDLPPEGAEQLVQAIQEMKAKIRTCAVCFNFSDQDTCEICRDERRDRTQICVVAEPRDLIAMENTGEYRGVYHVLHGMISPIDEVGPEDLRIRELLARLADDGIREVILATNPVVEGDATALYLARLIKPLGVKVTRIALGLPVGGDLDYADQVTVARALEGRTEM
jgi:recombination protein RecR